MKLCQATEWLLFHLWKENPVTDSTCPGVLIPEIVIYRWGRPHVWYFSGPQGKITRTTKEKITLDSIEKTFNKQYYESLNQQKIQEQNPNQLQTLNSLQTRRRPQVSAIKVTVQELTKQQIHKNQDHEQSQKEIEKQIGNYEPSKLTYIQQELVSFEYIESSNFKNFLHSVNNNDDNLGLQNDDEFSKGSNIQNNSNKQKNINNIMGGDSNVTVKNSSDMMLVKFVYPKNNRNQVIKVNWSPHFRLITKKENIYTMDNNQVSISEKLCTFQGPEHLTKQDSAISPVIVEDIEMICQNINTHISNITGTSMQIKQMILYFKLDDKNRLIFMYCTKLQIKDQGLILQFDKGYNIKNLSPRLKQVKTKNYVKSQSGNVQFNNGYLEKMLNNYKEHCSNCEELYPNLFDLKFKFIVDCFEKKLVPNEKTVLPQDMIKLIQEKENNTRKNKLTYTKNSEKKTKEEEYKENIEFLERERRSKECDYTKVPALIQKVWGSMTQEMYQSLSQNSSWLEYTTKVCDTCYLMFTQYTLESDFNRKAKQDFENYKKEIEYKNLRTNLQHMDQQIQPIQQNGGDNNMSEQQQQQYLHMQSPNTFNSTSTFPNFYDSQYSAPKSSQKNQYFQKLQSQTTTEQVSPQINQYDNIQSVDQVIQDNKQKQSQKQFAKAGNQSIANNQKIFSPSSNQNNSTMINQNLETKESQLGSDSELGGQDEINKQKIASQLFMQEEDSQYKKQQQQNQMDSIQELQQQQQHQQQLQNSNFSDIINIEQQQNTNRQHLNQIDTLESSARNSNLNNKNNLKKNRKLMNQSQGEINNQQQQMYNSAQVQQQQQFTPYKSPFMTTSAKNIIKPQQYYVSQSMYPQDAQQSQYDSKNGKNGFLKNKTDILQESKKNVTKVYGNLQIVKKNDNKIIKSGLPQIFSKNKQYVKDPIASDNSYLSTKSQSFNNSLMNKNAHSYNKSISIISDIKQQAKQLDLDLNNL